MLHDNTVPLHLTNTSLRQAFVLRRSSPAVLTLALLIFAPLLASLSSFKEAVVSNDGPRQFPTPTLTHPHIHAHEKFLQTQSLREKAWSGPDLRTLYTTTHCPTNGQW
jgi:hypothetical protein